MMVLITYDVNTEDAGGRKRLRQIAKQCVTKKKTACAFITSATNTRPASSTSAQKPAMPRKAR